MRWGRAEVTSSRNCSKQIQTLSNLNFKETILERSFYSQSVRGNFQYQTVEINILQLQWQDINRKKNVILLNSNIAACFCQQAQWVWIMTNKVFAICNLLWWYKTLKTALRCFIFRPFSKSIVNIFNILDSKVVNMEGDYPERLLTILLFHDCNFLKSAKPKKQN